jgi:hypothetical protein
LKKHYLLIAALLLATTGCKKLLKKSSKGSSSGASGPSQPSVASGRTTPPTPTWKESEVTFLELPSARGSVRLKGTDLAIQFSGLPKETKLTVDGQTSTADASGFIATKLDISSRLAKLAPKDAFDFRFKLAPETKIDLDFGPTAKLTLDVPSISVSFALTDLYKAAPDAPITLGDEKPPAQHTVLLMASSVEPLGPAKSLGEVDWVAVQTKLPAREGKSCGGYKKTTDGGSQSERAYTLQMIDEKLTVYEVKTGVQVATKDFKAKNECPMLVFNGIASSYASNEEKKVWLRELRTSKK